LRRAIKVAALLATAVTFLVATGIGLVLVLVPQSGERGSGALLVLAGCLALGGALFLSFAGDRHFESAGGIVLAAVTTLLAFIPVAGLAGAAIFFAGLPFGSVIPLADWSILALGILLALGACAILALGYGRVVRRPPPEPAFETRDLDAARRQLRDAFERDRAGPLRYDRDDDVRVTHVR
jgi:hypothetical protein